MLWCPRVKKKKDLMRQMDECGELLFHRVVYKCTARTARARCI
jgi:hypothetical protein